MAIIYKNLEASVRKNMLSELERDIHERCLYISPRLTDDGAKQWPQILSEAFKQHDDQWVAQELRSKNLINSEEQRRKPKGGFTTAKIPVTAPETLAEGEFNRFYIRGLCVDVINSGDDLIEVYRGKEVSNPRSESEAMIGKQVSAKDLLNDLRVSTGVDTALGLPSGPNSGLTICRINK
ncbi:MAG: hypothetical protein WC290_01595 [archaeon]|jgi:hypothetical protein